VGSTTIPLRRAPSAIHDPAPRSRAGRGIDHLMRVMFVVYLLVVVTGIVLYSVIGAAHL
jgi:hypothetical protein